jgi:pyruvate dehydrogenase E1 component
LIAFKNRFNLPLTDEQAIQLQFFKPAEDSAESIYLHAQRKRLGGYLPKRETNADVVPVPSLTQYGNFAVHPNGKEMSTTMAFVRLLGNLLKDAQLGPRIVPIVADEARTFGMANLFKQVGIYSSVGQRYEPEDIGSVLSYREAIDGQILEEGISEAGAIASWTAAATSYSVHGLAMLPFYIYYSMFGFQRIGDLIWAAADQRARGFLIGATSGRTTLGGEGLQHQDGSSHVVAATIPNCIAYDPAYAYELAVIVDDGMRRMLTEQEDVFYYITVTNENEAQPSMAPDSREGILRGLHRIKPCEQPQLRLLGAGPLLKETMAAAKLLHEQFGIQAEVWSVTSFSELARDGIACERARRLKQSDALPWITQQLSESNAPVIAVSDYVRTVAESVRAYVPAAYVTLGTDGFGRSDTRAALRDFFEVDARWISYIALTELFAGEQTDVEWRAIAKQLGLDIDKAMPSAM